MGTKSFSKRKYQNGLVSLRKAHTRPRHGNPRPAPPAAAHAVKTVNSPRSPACASAGRNYCHVQTQANQACASGA
jgi:hypothetical protein